MWIWIFELKGNDFWQFWIMTNWFFARKSKFTILLFFLNLNWIFGHKFRCEFKSVYVTRILRLILLVARLGHWTMCVYIIVYLLHIVAATAANHIAYASLATMLMVNYGYRVILTRPLSKWAHVAVWQCDDRMLIGIQITHFLTMLKLEWTTSTSRCMFVEVRKLCNFQNFGKGPDGFLIRPQFWSLESRTKKDRECDALHVQV